jgi:putative sigma-54 modulation protein
MLPINISGHHVEITPALRHYLEDKLTRLDRHVGKITNIHVVLSVEKKLRQIAEANVAIAGGVLRATSEAKDMYAAIDVLVDKLSYQATRHKEKQVAHYHGNGHHNGEDNLD